MVATLEAILLDPSLDQNDDFNKLQKRSFPCEAPGDCPPCIEKECLGLYVVKSVRAGNGFVEIAASTGSAISMILTVKKAILVLNVYLELLLNYLLTVLDMSTLMKTRLKDLQNDQMKTVVLYS